MSLIQCPIYEASQLNPNAIAVYTPSEAVSFQIFNELVNGYVATLQKKPLDLAYFAFLAVPTLETLVWLWALWRLGKVAVPMNPKFPSSYTQQLLKDLPIEWLQPGFLTCEKNTENVPFLNLKSKATAVFTSGSSGVPKCAVHSIGNWVAHAKGAATKISLGLGDIWELGLGVNHVGGLGILWRTALGAAAVGLPQHSQKASTHLSVVPAQLVRLLETGFNPQPVKEVLCGGAPFSDTLLNDASQAGFPLRLTYGLTEMTAQVTLSDPLEKDGPFDSGTVLPYRQLQVDSHGCLEVKGETLFQGYLSSRGLELPLTPSGWFETRDCGFQTQGRWTITGRADSVFISGGENISPEEIEMALGRLPGVLMARVVFVPSVQWGARPVAFVKVKGSFNAEMLRSQSKQVLPGFKVPDYFFEFPDSEASLKYSNEGLITLAKSFLK